MNLMYIFFNMMKNDAYWLYIKIFNNDISHLKICCWYNFFS